MNGKGSKQRPTNHEAFASSYEAIFGKKAKTELFGSKEYECTVFDEMLDARAALAADLDKEIQADN